MPKQSINLLVSKEEDTPLLRRLKKIFPIVSAVSLFLFLILFIFSIAYTNSNIKQFTALKTEVDQYEKKIINQKNTEGIYSLTVTDLNVLAQILSKSKNFSPILAELDKMRSSFILLDGAVVDSKGNLSVSLTASNSAALNKFVDDLTDLEETKRLYSGIEAYGIARDKKGKYLMSISLKANPSLFQ